MQLDIMRNFCKGCFWHFFFSARISSRICLLSRYDCALLWCRLMPSRKVGYTPFCAPSVVQHPSCHHESSTLHVTAMCVCVYECVHALVRVTVCVFWCKRKSVHVVNLFFIFWGPASFSSSHILCCHCIDRAFTFPRRSCFSVLLLFFVMRELCTLYFFLSLSQVGCAQFFFPRVCMMKYIKYIWSDMPAPRCPVFFATAHN